MKKILTTLFIVLSVSMMSHAKGKGFASRLDLGVANPNYLGSSNSVGIMSLQGFAGSLVYGQAALIDSIMGVGLQYGHENFAVSAGYFSTDASATTTTSESWSVAFGGGGFGLGVNDSTVISGLWDITHAVRLGFTSDQDSNATNPANKLGLAFDFSEMTLAFDYGMAENDDTTMTLGLGYQDKNWFVGVTHDQFDPNAGASSDSQTLKLGFNGAGWIFSLEYTPVETVDDTMMTYFTYLF